jgi:hypothetical protein
MYLQLDEGSPNEIIYALPILDAAKLGLEIYTEAEQWLKGRVPPGDKR